MHYFGFIIMSLFSNLAFAQTEELLTVDVQGAKPIKESMVSGSTSELLNDISSVSMRKNGGIADTPSIQGLSNDRVNVKIDGSIITNSCPNHMNPALSFVHPDQVVGIENFAGLDPVSNGGDNIAGTILVKTNKVKFTQDGIEKNLRLRTFYKSNNFNSGAALSSHLSSKNYYFSYEGLQEKAGRYKDGNGKRLKGTIYEQNNQAVVLGKKINSGDMSLKLSRSYIPYQGFVNQYMDLLDNEVNLMQLSLNKRWNELKIEFLSSFTHTDHYMNKIRSERMGKMPMDTSSDEFNSSLKFQYHSVNFGLEYFQYRLEDWWDPVIGSMMGPETFQSIHQGKRDRLGVFVENTFNKGEKIEVLAGIRSDVVMMNTAKVHGYNSNVNGNAPVDAAYFNSQNRARTDVNFDALLAVRHNMSEGQMIEMGYARKSRSPNMYERYSWAGTQTAQAMDMRMINWFGDGNGYVGDVDLKPEVAHKFSVKYGHNDKSRFKFEIAPFFNYVENYIDANLLRSSGGIAYLQFANEDAVLYGFDMNADASLYTSEKLGEFSLNVASSYTRGYRVDKKADLYHLMPLNLNLGLKHQLSFWSNDLTLRMVSQKETVNKMRLEAKTAGYALVDFATRFKWSKFTWELGVSNILDKDYQMPLAGVDLVNYRASSKTAQFGMGRSYNTNFIMEF